jgi:hypothetical protein
MAHVFENSLYAIIFLEFCIALIIISVTSKTLSPLSRYIKQRGDDDTIIYFSVIAIGTLLWPMLWFFALGPDIVKKCPTLLIALLWPIGLGIFQLYDIYYDRCENIEDHQSHRASLITGITGDTATIITVSFAIGTLFIVLGIKQQLFSPARLLVIGLIICIGLIFPTNHFVDNNQQYTTYVRVAQRVFVNYCIGFIITALIVAVTNCIEQSNQSLGQPTQSNQSLGQPTQSNQSLNRNKTLNYLL